MKTKNCTRENLQAALNIVNQKYEGNIKFKSIEPKGKQFQFTLTVIDSKKPGHRRGFPEYKDMFSRNPVKVKDGKRLAAACWHVHGDFFDALFEVNPKAGVFSAKGNWITIHGGNWQDWNIGSNMFPLYFSEACDCNRED